MKIRSILEHKQLPYKRLTNYKINLSIAFYILLLQNKLVYFQIVSSAKICLLAYILVNSHHISNLVSIKAYNYGQTKETVADWNPNGNNGRGEICASVPDSVQIQ